MPVDHLEDTDEQIPRRHPLVARLLGMTPREIAEAVDAANAAQLRDLVKAALILSVCGRR